jgi:hypothetical protein
MSSLLEQAIIDAKLLKETARKNAEAALLEQFADTIKSNMDTLLEADDGLGGDLGLDGGLGGDAAAAPAPMPAPAAAPVQPKNAEQEKLFDRIPPAYLGEDNMQEIEINLDTLVEKVENMQQELGVVAPIIPQYTGGQVVPHGNPERTGWLSEEVELDEESLTEAGEGTPQDQINIAGAQKELATASKTEAEAAGKRGDAMAKVNQMQALATQKGARADMQNQAQQRSVNEQDELEEESMVIDIEAEETPGGINWHKGRYAKEDSIRLMLKTQKGLETENDELRETLSAREAELEELHEKLNGLVGKLQETKGKFKKSVELNVQLKDVAQNLTENLNKVNLLNARLLYTNKVLGNGSLNERQKQRIAESISSASTVDEAKTIYNTLQRSAGATTERKVGPQSLTEAISRAPSPFVPRNTQPQENAESIRWKKIAGIIK